MSPPRYLYLILLALTLLGCPAAKDVDQEPPEEVSFGDLKLLVVNDLPLSEAIAREWSARAEGDLQVDSISLEEFRQLESVDADAVIYPGGLLGELVKKKVIEPFPAAVLEDDRFAKDDNLPFARSAEVKWGKRQYAVSFGSPQFLLAYRRDLLEQIGAAPPTTWEEYAELVRLLAKNPPADSNGSWEPAAEPRGKGWAAQLFLAQAAASVREPSRYSVLFDYKTMEPQLNTPGFQRVLEEMVAVAKQTQSSAGYTPDQARAALLENRTAMAITWPSGSPVPSGPDLEPLSIEFAQLPGSTEIYSSRSEEWQVKENKDAYRVPLCGIEGRLGSVVKGSDRGEAAALCLAILAGTELSPLIVPASNSTGPYRLSHTSSPEIWMDAELSGAATTFVEAIVATQNERYWVFVPRIPGRERYLIALDEAVRPALDGNQTAQDALDQATAAWNEITDDLGRESQSAAYRRSLGLN